MVRFHPEGNDGLLLSQLIETCLLSGCSSVDSLRTPVLLQDMCRQAVILPRRRGGELEGTRHNRNNK